MKKNITIGLAAICASVLFTGCALMDKPYAKSTVELKNGDDTAKLQNEKGVACTNVDWTKTTQTITDGKTTNVIVTSSIKIGSLVSGISSNDAAAMWSGQSLSKHETGQNINITLTNMPAIIQQVK